MIWEKHDAENQGANSRDDAHPTRPYWKRAHRDWRVWIAAMLMLALMLAYVMTNSLVFSPGNTEAQPVPELNAP